MCRTDSHPARLAELGDFAKAAGYTNAGDKPQPFDGYYFKILTKQGEKRRAARRTTSRTAR